MVIDWAEFQRSIDVEIAAAAAETSKSLAMTVSSLTRLTDDEIIELFPTPADVQKLKQLMEIVKSDEDENTKINRLVANVTDLGKTAILLIDKFA